MKKKILVLIVIILSIQISYSQDITLKGKPIAEIFTGFRANLNDTSATTGFSLERAYFGYNFISDRNLSGTIILNIGQPDDLPDGVVPRRYAYIREASITYSKDRLKIDFGITGTRLFDFQQKFWGKRYIANTYQSINGYGFVADLGIAADYRFSDKVKADVTIMNGEGYSNVQLDNSIKVSAGLLLNPTEKTAIRLYGDIQRVKGLWQPMGILFIGLKNSIITIGGEATYKSNLDKVSGHHAWGISATGGINISEKLELFARYDYSTSLLAGSANEHWNNLLDGTFLIVGSQYSFNPNVKLSLNFQGRNPHDSGIAGSDGIFLNALFKF